MTTRSWNVGARTAGFAGFMALGASFGLAQVDSAETLGRINLPTSKQIVGAVPGSPQRLNSLPVSMAVSLDGRYVVTVNAGYGTFQSGYRQSLAVMETASGTVTDFPDARTGVESGQILFSGLAFSADGRHLYASLASGTDPQGAKAGDTGSGIAVYGFIEGRLTPERVLRIPMQPLAAGRSTLLIEGVSGTLGVPYPAGIALVPTLPRGEHRPEDSAPERLLVTDNLSDDVLLLDAASGRVITRFDVAENDAVPSVYPGPVAVSPDGRHAYVGLWNGSEIVELDLVRGVVARKLALLKPSSPTAAGSHPSAILLSPNGGTLYVALANRDMVAAVDLRAGNLRVKGFFDVRLPGQTYFGAQPESLALSEDGKRMYVANMGSDAVAVIDVNALKPGHRTAQAAGFLPTEWLPMAVTVSHGKLFVATGKGHGTGPNNFPQKAVAGDKPSRSKPDFTYIATLLHGSLAAIDLAAAERTLAGSTAETLEANRMKAASEHIPFAAGVNPIKHVIYIIKENRTYDQVFGDLKVGGKPVGNGDPSLTLYGDEITPNQHKLALQFGVLDNFYDSGEVSGDGHVWSTTAIGTDYLERTWEGNYRGGQRGYDFEGLVSEGYPILQKIPDVNEPSSGYLWGNLARHGKTFYHFGEYISSTFCTDRKSASPASQAGPMTAGARCPRNDVKPGETLPAEWGGGANKWPWAIPLLAANVATKPELVGHFAPEAPDFNLRIPDQIRVDIFERHLAAWVAARHQGRDEMPGFVMLRLGNDHTAGTTPGGPTPSASIADNDLAVGRAVEAIARSPFWDDTAFFILEDDAQNGADHVDAHRSPALVVSKYAPRPSNGVPAVDSRFYTTVSFVRTMENLLGLPPMNNNDAFAPLVGSLFSGPGTQPGFTADTRNRDNGLIYTANRSDAPGAKESSRMDFRHADHADPERLNVILWKDAMSGRAVPGMLTARHKRVKKDDDD